MQEYWPRFNLDKSLIFGGVRASWQRVTFNFCATEEHTPTLTYASYTKYTHTNIYKQANASYYLPYKLVLFNCEAIQWGDYCWRNDWFDCKS